MSVKINWTVQISGTWEVKGTNDHQQAATILKQLLGSGVSVAAALHQPPGVEFKVEMETESKPQIEVPNIIVNNNIPRIRRE